jgi:hypothetical protein
MVDWDRAKCEGAYFGISFFHLIRELAGVLFSCEIDKLGRAGMQVRRYLDPVIELVLALCSS